MEWLLDPHVWASFATLTVLEIVLGIDNLVFVALLAGRLPQERQGKAGPRNRPCPGACDTPCPAWFDRLPDTPDGTGHIATRMDFLLAPSPRSASRKTSGSWWRRYASR